MSEVEWGRVFEIRCEAKRGRRLSLEDESLARRAHAEDPGRYAAMNEDVLEETKPFGTARVFRRDEGGSK